jgi:hypothetical protein
MADVLGLLRGDPETDGRTRAYTEAIAKLLGADPQVIKPVTGHTAEVLGEVCAGAEVRGLVLPVGPDPPEDTWPLTRATTKPVVMLGPRVPEVPEHMSVGLVPLDGLQRTSRAIADVLAELRGAGMRLHAVHVFDRGNVPAFWDPAHSEEPWATEFVRRHLDDAAELDIRRGIPAHELFAVAESGRFDLVVVAWQQSVKGDRATVVRRCVLDGSVPVMLLAAGDRRHDSGPSALAAADSPSRDWIP